MINLRRGELCSPAKSNSYLYFGRTQFAPTGFKLKFEKTDKPQFTDITTKGLLSQSLCCILLKLDPLVEEVCACVDDIEVMSIKSIFRIIG